MKTNIAKALINMTCIPCPDIKKYYADLGRADNLNDAVMEYIKDCFACTVREKTNEGRARKMASVFSDTDKNSFTVTDGDAVQISIVSDKDCPVTYPEEVKAAKGDKQLLYITAVTDGTEKLRALYLTYGSVYITSVQGQTVPNPANALNSVYTKTADCKWEVMCVIPDDIYHMQHKQNRLELEALVQMGRGVEAQDVTVAGTPAKLFKSIR